MVGDPLPDRIDAHAVGSCVKHPLELGLRGLVVRWTVIACDIAFDWLKCIQLIEESIGAGRLVEADIGAVDRGGIRFPIVRDYAKSLPFGKARDHTAAGEEIGECSLCQAGPFDRAGDERQELAFAADVGDQLGEEVVAGAVVGMAAWVVEETQPSLKFSGTLCAWRIAGTLCA